MMVINKFIQTIKAQILLAFLFSSLLPIVLLGAFVTYNQVHSSNLILTTSNDSLLNITRENLLMLTENHAEKINDFFTRIERQLDESALFVSEYWQRQFLIDLMENDNLSISNDYFSGEINGTITGEVNYYDSGDYIDYNNDGINDFLDFGADFLGDVSSISDFPFKINGSVDLCVNATYQGKLISPSAYVQLQLLLTNGSKEKIDITDYYLINNNTWSSLIHDDWSPDNPDGLTGELTSLNTRLVELNVSKIEPFFYVYDNSMVHHGTIISSYSSKRIEGVIKGNVSGYFNGIIRGTLTANVSGRVDQRLKYLEPFFRQIYKQNQQTFSWVYLGRPEMGYLYQYPWNPNFSNNTIIYVGPNYDCKKRAWYIETMDKENEIISQYPDQRGNNSFWTNLVLDFNTRKVSINLGRVIYDRNNQLIGPLEFKLVIEEIQEEVISLSVGRSGYAFLIDSTGKLLASPDYTKMKNAVPLSSADDFQSGNLLGSDNPTFIEIINLMIRGENGVAEVSLPMFSSDEENNGELITSKKVIIAFSPVTRTGWSFGIIIPKDEVIQKIEDVDIVLTELIETNLLATVLLFFFVAIMASVIAVRLSSNFSLPLQRIIHGVEKISAGDLSHRIVVSERCGQLYMLAESINQMVMNLEQSKEDYRSLVENIHVGIFRVKNIPKNSLFQINQALVDMFGYSTKEEMSRVDIKDLYANPEDRNDFIAILVKKGIVSNRVTLFKRKNGETFWGSVSARAVFDDKGVLKWHDGILEDITDRKRSEEVVKTVKRQEELYHAMLTHFINNNLHKIRNNLELLMLNYKYSKELDKETINKLNEIIEQSSKTIDLVNLIFEVLQQENVPLTEKNLLEEIKEVIHSYDDQNLPLDFVLKEEEFNICLKINKYVKRALIEIIDFMKKKLPNVIFLNCYTDSNSLDLVISLYELVGQPIPIEATESLAKSVSPKWEFQGHYLGLALTSVVMSSIGGQIIIVPLKNGNQFKLIFPRELLISEKPCSFPR